MPRRFEDLRRAIGRRRISHISNSKTAVLNDEILRCRDKCSRGFSEIQYFTKEILFFKPELVAYFLVLTSISASLTEMCKSRLRPNSMTMNKLSENGFQRHISSCQLNRKGRTNVGSHSNFLETTALTKRVSPPTTPAFRAAQNDASGTSLQELACTS